MVHPRVGGETQIRVNRPSIGHQTVHPRVGGEWPELVGDSSTLEHSIRWSIPAWAGKPSTPVLSGCIGAGVHPRVGGETQNLHAGI